MNKLVEVENQALRSDLEKFGPGDTVKVHFRVHEGKKDKVQAFQGVCIKIKGSGPSRSFTLRKISQGIGIERIFPMHSPVIEKIEILRYGKVRRAKLYYLRDKVGKKRQVKERIVSKKKEAKKPRRKKKAKAAAEEVTKTAKEETKVTEAVETPVEEEVKEKPENKPAVEDPAKEDPDGKSESGPRGVEEG